MDKRKRLPQNDEASALQNLKAENARLKSALKEEQNAHRALQETAARQSQELTLLEKTRAAIATQLELPQLLRKIVEAIVEVYGYQHVSIYLLKGDVLILQHQVGYVNFVERISIYEAVNGRVVRTGQSALVTSDDPDFLVTDGHIRSEATVPIKINGEVIGTLNTESDRQLTKTDLKIAEALAVELSASIERSKLYERLQKRNHALSALQEAALAIVGRLEFSNAAKAVVTQAARLLNSKHGYIYLIKDDVLKVITDIDESPKYLGATLKKGEGMAGKVWASAAPLIINDYSAWVGRSEKFDDYPFRSIIGVPLMQRDEVIGVLELSRVDTDEVFSENDQEILMHIAQLAAIAIENASLYERFQTELDERKQTEDALRQAEAKYRGIFENAVEGIYQSLPQGALKTVNPAFAAMLGYDSPQELLRSITDAARQLYWNPAQREEFIRQIESRGEITAFEYQLRRKDGTPIWVSENSRIARDENGKTLYYEGIVEDITFRKESEQRLDRQLRQLNALHAIDNAINSNFDLRAILDVVLREVADQLRADASSILFFNKDAHTLDYAAGRGFNSNAIQHTKLNVGEGYAGRVALDRQTIHIPNLTEAGNNRLRQALNFAEEKIVAYVGAPLIAKGQIVGVLEIFQRSPLHPDADWFSFLSVIANQAAIAIENAHLFENLQRANFELTLAYDATIEGWSRALDLRDHETEGHTQRVANLTVRLARKLGVSDADILHIRRGALLHDIGKVGIPDGILNKPAPLTEQEWEIMRQHPLYAYKMLRPIKYLRPALDIPRYHHERWDGAGYPEGLRGDIIPLAARIFAIADVWDALTNDRPYRAAWDKNKALEYIRLESNRHFDPKIADNFLSLILKEPF